VGMGKVSYSASEALAYGYLRPTDRIIMNRERLLSAAKASVLAMDKEGYVQPKPRDDIRLPGASMALPTANLMLYTMQKGGYVTDHDVTVTRHLVRIFSGGDIAPGTCVSEQHILDLEKEAFLSLCGEEKSQQRMEHMLTTGKPLRN